MVVVVVVVVAVVLTLSHIIKSVVIGHTPVTLELHITHGTLYQGQAKIRCHPRVATSSKRRLPFVTLRQKK